MSRNEDRLPIGRLVFLLSAIAFTLAILIQNFQPFVTVYFLGAFSIPIPLSVAILAAFAGGCLAALIFNQIAFWLDRRNTDFDEPEASKKVADPIRDRDIPKPPKQSYTEDKDTYAYPSRQTRLQDEDEEDDDEDDDEDDVIDVKYIKKPGDL